jgi:uncharacterized membrane protein YhaH (DUF805 family)
LFAVAMYLAAWSPRWLPGRDSSGYLGIGRSLAEGRGYAFNGQVVAWFSPGLPLVWAGVLGLFGESYLVLNGLLMGCAFATAAAAFAVVRRLGGRAAAWAVALLLLCSHSAFYRAFSAETDLPFLALVTLAVLGFALFFEGRWWGLGLAAAGLLAGFAMRAPGILVFPGLFVGLFIEKGRINRRRQWIGVAAVALLLAAALGVWLAVQARYRVPGQATYVSHTAVLLAQPWPQRAGRLVAGLGHAPHALVRLVTDLQVLPAACLPVALVMALGMAHDLRRGRWALSGLCGGCVVLLALMAGPEGVARRYLLVLLPWAFYFLLAGAAVLFVALRRWQPRTRPGAWMVGVLVLLAAANLARDVELVVRVRRSVGPWVEHRHWPKVRMLSEWVSRNTRPTDVALLDEPNVVHYATGRRAFDLEDNEMRDTDLLRRRIEQTRPDVVALTERIADVAALKATLAPDWAQAGRVSGYTVLRRAAAPPPDAP